MGQEFASVFPSTFQRPGESQVFLTLLFLADKVSYFQTHNILIGRYNYLPMPIKITNIVK